MLQMLQQTVCLLFLWLAATADASRFDAASPVSVVTGSDGAGAALHVVAISARLQVNRQAARRLQFYRLGKATFNTPVG
jgi:hypothetical protein